jgi:hypothetical protein
MQVGGGAAAVQESSAALAPSAAPTSATMPSQTDSPENNNPAPKFSRELGRNQEAR